MSALYADLQAKGLKQTLVILATEFGHTPGISDNDGREHDVFTCLLGKRSTNG